jgi:hypothetical protein
MAAMIISLAYTLQNPLASAYFISYISLSLWNMVNNCYHWYFRMFFQFSVATMTMTIFFLLMDPCTLWFGFMVPYSFFLFNNKYNTFTWYKITLRWTINCKNIFYKSKTSPSYLFSTQYFWLFKYIMGNLNLTFIRHFHTQENKLSNMQLYVKRISNILLQKAYQQKSCISASWSGGGGIFVTKWQ